MNKALKISQIIIHKKVKTHSLLDTCIVMSFSTDRGNQLSKNESMLSKLDWKPIEKPIRQRPINFLVLRNYLVPQRPKLFKQIHTFLSYTETEPSGLSVKEIRYKVKNMEEDEIIKYQKLKKQQNKSIQYQQQAYDKIFGKAIKKLPFYYHMLLAQTQLPYQSNSEQIQIQNNKINNGGNSTKQNQETNNSQQSKQIQEEQQIDYSSIQKYLDKSLTPHQMFTKLYTIHPYIKYTTYNKYTQIHDEHLKKQINKNSSFSKFAMRVPLLYFKHPYQLYMIDQCQKKQQQLLAQEQYLTIQSIKDFDKKFQKLSKNLKQEYEWKAQKLISQYSIQIQKISMATKLPISRIHRLIQNQFNQENQKMIEHIVIK